MTNEEVKQRVEEIRLMANDDEMAHIHEASLYEDLLQSIADGTCDEPSKCASSAISTSNIDFSRWYA